MVVSAVCFDAANSMRRRDGLEEFAGLAPPDDDEPDA